MESKVEEAGKRMDDARLAYVQVKREYGKKAQKTAEARSRYEAARAAYVATTKAE